jgi:hypothetical protein
MVTQVGTAWTYSEMTCSGTALKQPSGASYWEVAVTHSSWADAEPSSGLETTLRDCLRLTTTLTTRWNWTGQSWVRVYCHVKWHPSPPLLDVTDQLQPRHIPLQETSELFYTDKWQDSFAGRSTTEELDNTRRQRRLSSKTDVIAARYNVKLRAMTETGLNWLRYRSVACSVMTVANHHIMTRAGRMLMKCIITKCWQNLTFMGLCIVIIF